MLAEHRPPRDAATVNEGTQEATQVTAEQRPRSHARRTALVRHTRPSPRCLSTAPTREPHPQSQTAPIATTDSARVPAKPHMLKYWRLTPVTPVLEHTQVPTLEATANVNMPPLDTAVNIRILDISRVAATTRVVSFQGLDSWCTPPPCQRPPCQRPLCQRLAPGPTLLAAPGHVPSPRRITPCGSGPSQRTGGLEDAAAAC